MGGVLAVLAYYGTAWVVFSDFTPSPHRACDGETVVRLDDDAGGHGITVTRVIAGSIFNRFTSCV